MTDLLAQLRGLETDIEPLWEAFKVGRRRYNATHVEDELTIDTLDEANKHGILELLKFLQLPQIIAALEDAEDEKEYPFLKQLVASLPLCTCGTPAATRSTGGCPVHGVPP